MNESVKHLIKREINYLMISVLYVIKMKNKHLHLNYILTISTFCKTVVQSD